MFEYVQRLPDKPVGSRQRFVVFATALSFLVIFFLWLMLVTIGRPSPAERSTPSPQETAALPVAGENGAPGPLVPAATPAVNVGDISANLLKVFGSPEPRPAAQP